LPVLRRTSTSEELKKPRMNLLRFQDLFWNLLLCELDHDYQQIHVKDRWFDDIADTLMQFLQMRILTLSVCWNLQRCEESEELRHEQNNPFTSVNLFGWQGFRSWPPDKESGVRLVRCTLVGHDQLLSEDTSNINERRKLVRWMVSRNFLT
jgi:hypothetical protein